MNIHLAVKLVKSPVVAKQPNRVRNRASGDNSAGQSLDKYSLSDK